MRAAECAHRIHGDRHAEPPARGDDNPPGVLAFGLVEHHVGDHAIAQDDQQHGAEQFCKKRWHRVEWEAAKLPAPGRLVYTFGASRYESARNRSMRGHWVSPSA